MSFNIIGQSTLAFTACPSVATFIKLSLLDHVEIMIALVVCAAMAGTVFFSKLVGCTLPLLAKKVGFDPAVMASPLITTIVDAMSLVIYFNIATMVLNF